MVQFIGLDESEARRRLLTVGTEIFDVGAEGSDDEREKVSEVLPQGERHVRGTFDAKPPEPGLEHTAHCAWHVNGVHEVHTITSGRGVFEFWTGKGVVTIVTEPGDLLVNRGAEHRFLPVEDQRLVLRHSGKVDGEFAYVATGRTPEPWPEVSATRNQDSNPPSADDRRGEVL